ncbi:thioredoxin domain-containing protein [Candidatus Micrarchaeota archaeon]|nr:thioredoxin domain-containing protein [Candidatus Micrarchaeota archaeon]
MVLCIIALVVFSVLGIFSAKYRVLAKEALGCVIKTATFKPCEGDLEDRLRRGILKSAFKISPTLAKYINKYFSLLSWAFVLLFFGSTIYTGIGIYNYFAFGNCNGPNSTGFCVFDVLGGGSGSTNETGCPAVGFGEGSLIAPTYFGTHKTGGENAKVIVVEFGCYSCPYTQQAQPAVNEIIKKYGDKIQFAFLALPLPNHKFSNETALAAECASEQGKFWEYHNKLFDEQEGVKNEGISKLSQIAGSLELDVAKFNSCVADKKYLENVQKSFDEGVKVGIYGTPTFFINGKPLVGPKTVDELSREIDAGLR